MRTLALVVSALFVLGGASACGTSGTSDADKTTTTAVDDTTTTESEEPTTTTTTTATTATTTGEQGSGDRDDYIAGLAENLQANDPSAGELEFDADQAECVATEWIDVVGAETFEAGDVSPTDLREDNFQFAELGIDDGQAGDMIDAIDGCGVDAIAGLRTALDVDLDATQQKCVATELDDETIRTVLIDTLVLGAPGAEVMPKLKRVEEDCKLG